MNCYRSIQGLTLPSQCFPVHQSVITSPGNGRAEGYSDNFHVLKESIRDLFAPSATARGHVKVTQLSPAAATTFSVQLEGLTYNGEENRRSAKENEGKLMVL
jgi:hypothetical protein